ncbi:hypothetical protein V1517DRAFT_369937 [Lipomyces orientalis]|uniref:Uncharacterized protein n=1 Tax=Lipomyces orientalis TaxID=1233043 RepID=A0ACC3TDJ0_9ASCO
MSTAPISATIPIDEFRAKLKGAVEARVFILRFEDDATSAGKDANYHFCRLYEGRVWDCNRNFQLAAFDVQVRIMAKLKRLLCTRSLLIKMLWSMINYIVMSDDSLQYLDVLGVLDGSSVGCRGTAVRTGSERSIQLLASCGDRHTVRSHTDGVTFTHRFCHAAQALKNAGNLSVSVESLFGELQMLKPPGAPDAVHKITGKDARRLALSVNQRSASNLEPPMSSSNETNVLFKIKLTGGRSDVILNDFLQLTKTIPPKFKLTLDEAYESTSLVLICRASWETFARLRSTLDSALVASVKGPSLVRCKMLSISV